MTAPLPLRWPSCHIRHPEVHREVTASKLLPRSTCIAALLFGSSGAAAQVIERNLPPLPHSQLQPLAPADQLPAEQDDRPIGPALRSIVALGAADDLAVDTASGVATSRVERLNTPRGRALLAPFLGRTLSRKLISDLEATITRYYRSQGYPFVSISVPEQEITQGVLQLRVLEFTAGIVAAPGGSRSDEAFIRSRLRQRSGEPIEAGQLTQDLDWLNRNPFRTVEALFSPGEGLGRSNLTLPVSEIRPWRVYAGASNAGTSATGWTRLFAGFQAAPLRAAPDLLLSYQFTSSDDLFTGDRSAYRSHAGIMSLGIAPRQAIDVTLANVATSQDAGPFGIEQRTSEAILGWRAAAGGLGDIRLGVEARRGKRTVWFGDFPVADLAAEVFQLYGGIEKAATDALGRSYLSLTLHFSPGGISGRNASSSLAAYTAGRVTDSTYAYLEGSYTRFTRIGRANLGTELIGRLASGPLPDTEQVGIGGAGLVRGYSLDDGGYDSGLVIRNTLYAPVMPLATGSTVQPYGFFDTAYAHQRVVGVEATPTSIGAGANVRFGNIFNSNIDLARALKSAPYTREGDWRIHVRATISY
jgi:hemolysin activation/secretion protein